MGLSGAGDASQIPGMWAQMAARTRAKGWAMLHRFPECGIKPRKVEGSLIHKGGGCLGRYKGVTKHATPPPLLPSAMLSECAGFVRNPVLLLCNPAIVEREKIRELWKYGKVWF